MDSEPLCFSTTSILRCENTSSLKIYLLIIPPAIEVFFAVTLLLANWSKGRRHLWITAEGCIYFSLVLIEMFSQILPAVRDRLDIFEVFDIVLAAASSVPTLCYLFFLFLFARAELIDILPRRFQMVSKLILLILIPVIVTLSELASFIGVSHKVTNRPTIVFTNDRDKNIWRFFSSFTLALLAAYQFISFCLAFYRLTRAILTQRLIEVTAIGGTQSLQGTAWVTVGLKLGEIETIIGFAANGYWSAMTRRIVRLIARASLIVGLIKGFDTTERFTTLEDELTRRRSFRHSRLRSFISSPRFSMLRQLSPGAATSHSPSRAPQDLVFSPPLPEDGIATSESSTEVIESWNVEKRGLADRLNRERVTVRLENGTPRLDMRFSALEIPKFHDLTRNNLPYTPTVVRKSRPSAPHPATSRANPSDLSSPSDAVDPVLMLKTWPDVTNGTLPTENALDLPESPRVNSPYSKETLSESLFSIPTRPGSPVDSYTSLSTVRELVSQFPPLPTRVLESNEQSAANKGLVVDFCDDSPSVVPRASVGPTISSREFVATPFTTGHKHSKTIATTRYTDLTAPDSIVTTATTTVSGFMATPAMSHPTAFTDEPYVDPGYGRGSLKTKFLGKDTSGVVAPTRDPVDWIDLDGIPGSSLSPVIEETGGGQIRHSQRSGSTESLRISWLHSTEEPQLAQAVSLKSQMARIKSIGKAPRRVTPRPVKNGHLRDSLHIERIHVPAREDAYSLEIVQGSLRSPYDQIVSRDSDGMEDSNRSYKHVNNPGYI